MTEFPLSSTLPQIERIVDFLDRHALLTPHADAVVDGELRLTYKALQQQVGACARSLMASGISAGDRVATLAPPSLDFWVHFLATCSIGAIWLGLNPRYTLEELEYVVKDAKPKLIFARSRIGDRDYLADVGELAKAADTPVQIILLDPPETGSVSHSYNAFLQATASVSDVELENRKYSVGLSNAALIVYTSGTTGKPKGAVISHGSLALCADSQARIWPVEPLRILNNLPINHIGCVGDIACYALAAGGAIIFRGKFDPEDTLAVIQKEKITCWGQVPTMFQLALQHRKAASYDLSSVQLAIWSGSAASRELIEMLLARIPAAATSYGLTESVGSVTFTHPSNAVDTLINTVGTPAPHFEVRVVDPDGVDVVNGSEGELLLRGAGLFSGYWDNPEATASAIDGDGWFHTGDVVVRQPNGDLAIVGRRKEMFKSGGYNVYPLEIEAVLHRHTDISMACVLGIPDALYGEAGVAFVVSKSAKLTDTNVIDFCRSSLANYKIPKKIVFLDDMPMLPIGKIDKVTLKNRILARTSA